MMSFALRAACAALTLLACAQLAIADDEKKPMSFDEYKQTVAKVDYQKHRMSLKEFEKARTKKNTYVLDLRDERAYNEGHIKGALRLGADITAEKLAKLVPSKTSTVVIYCSNTLFPTRMIALTHPSLSQIMSLGYENTFVLEEIWHKNINAGQEFTNGPLWEKPNKPQ